MSDGAEPCAGHVMGVISYGEICEIWIIAALMSRRLGVCML